MLIVTFYRSIRTWGKKVLHPDRNFCYVVEISAISSTLLQYVLTKNSEDTKKKHNRKPYEKEWNEMKKQNVYNPKCNAEGRFIIVGLNFFFSRFRGGAISLRSVRTVLFP